MQNQIAEVAAKIKAEKSTGTLGFVRKPKVEKVPMKLDLTHQSQVELNDPPAGFGKGVVVVVSDGNYTRQITIHRPIGATKLQADDWVATPTGDVQSFLSMAKDPSAGKKAAALEKAKTDWSLSNGWYSMDKDTKALSYKFQKDQGSMTFAAASDQAKKAWAEARDSALQDYLEECRRTLKPPKKDWKFGQTEGHFMPLAVKAHEEALKKALSESTTWKATQLAILTPYETKGGSDQSRPQSAIGFQEPYSEGQVVDQIYRHLVNTLGGGYNVPIPPSKSLIKAWGPDLSEADAAKQIVAKVIAKAPDVNPSGSGKGSDSTPKGGKP
jgi:predicted HicB family RNase H-like nuclease